MKRQIFILTLIFASAILTNYGQTCTHQELSKVFDFQTSIKRITRNELSDSCIIKIIVKSKTTRKIIQTISFTSTFLLGDSSFVHCNNARSYSTGVNGGMQVLDWDYGDIIVADFNFDDKEDFAVKREEGGNGGPAYNYYVQTIDSTFILDKFLSNSIDCFPTYFNKDKKTLTSICRLDTVTDRVTIYKYDTLNNKWVVINSWDIDNRRKY